MTEPSTETALVKRDRWDRDSSGLTIKQRNFIAEFPLDWNATQAAIRAGYSPNSAKDIGYELTHNPKIIDAMTAHLAKRDNTAEVNRKWVLARLVHAEKEATAAIKDAPNKHAQQVTSIRLARLRSIELIGRHVDINAFRDQLGISGPDGSPLWDLSRLDDEELETFERLIAKVSVVASDPRREGEADQGAGQGEDQE